MFPSNKPKEKEPLVALIDSPPSKYRVRIPVDEKRMRIVWVDSYRDAIIAAQEANAAFSQIPWTDK